MGRYVDRNEAMQIAVIAGQVEIGQTYQLHTLFSEDLWSANEMKGLFKCLYL